MSNPAETLAAAKATGTIAIGRTRDGSDIRVSLDDLAALEKARDLVEKELVIIRNKVTAAKAQSAVGEFMEGTTYAKLTGAMRFKGYVHQMLLRRIAELKRLGRSNKSDSLAEAFINAARRRLDRELFLSLMDEAREEATR